MIRLAVLGLMLTGCGSLGLTGSYQRDNMYLNFEDRNTDLDFLIRNATLRGYECRRLYAPHMDTEVTDCWRVFP